MNSKTKVNLKKVKIYIKILTSTFMSSKMQMPTFFFYSS